MKGRGISKGMAEGEIVALESSFSFLGGVDQSSGLLQGSDSMSIAGKVFAFTEGRGSTVGSYTMLEMKRRGTLPVAILNTIAEPIVTTGAVLCRIPLVDSIDVSVLRNVDRVIVDGTRGTVKVEGVELKEVVTCILTNGGRFLILKRSEKVGTFKGKWAGVSGFVEVGEEPLQTAVKEMSEEVNVTDARLMKKAEAILIRSGDIVWKMHPFLFAIDDVRVEIDWEHTEHRWILAENLREVDTVPGLDKVIRALLSE